MKRIQNSELQGWLTFGTHLFGLGPLVRCISLKQGGVNPDTVLGGGFAGQLYLSCTVFEQVSEAIIEMQNVERKVYNLIFQMSCSENGYE